MGINNAVVKKVAKSAENLWVQYSVDGKFAEIIDGHFIARVSVAEYKKDGFVASLGTDLPTDKTKSLVRNGKKGSFKESDRVKSEGMMQIAKNSVPVIETKLLYEAGEKMVRIYRYENGDTVAVDTKYADIIKGNANTVGSGKYDSAITLIADGEPVAIVLPMNVKKSEILAQLAIDEADMAKPVKDEPLSAPTYEEVEEAEEGEEEATEEATDEVDELDSPEEIAKNIVKEGEEEPLTVVDDWTVPSDIFIEVTPNGTMWAIGKTKPEKENLKRLGFHYAPKAERAKKAGYPGSAWYRKPKAVEVAAD